MRAGWKGEVKRKHLGDRVETGYSVLHMWFIRHIIRSLICWLGAQKKVCIRARHSPSHNLEMFMVYSFLPPTVLSITFGGIGGYCEIKLRECGKQKSQGQCSVSVKEDWGVCLEFS